MLLITGKNIKLAKDVSTFNLPAIKTCPGKTLLCQKICYARRAEARYKTVRIHRERNYEESRKADFVKKIINILKRRVNIKKVRIHESGDFYSQSYLNKWVKIAEACPWVTFLAYTRNYKLDYSEVPKNLIIYYSIDPCTVKVKEGLKKSYIIKDVSEHIKGTVLCMPVKGGHRNYCGSRCTNCWSGKQEVCFMKH